jgi:hypothetical protein
MDSDCVRDLDAHCRRTKPVGGPLIIRQIVFVMFAIAIVTTIIRMYLLGPAR